MGLVSKTVKMKWHSVNKKYYESLGYSYTKMGDEFEVKVEDLTKGSVVKVKCKCDGCGREITWTYDNYNRAVKENENTYCKICGTNFSKNGKASFISFYNWCIDSNREDVLSRWDYDKNNCSPKDITYSTNKKYYFKCDIHPEHCSELKHINSFTSGKEGSITCNQCRSIAQYILDNFKGKDLYDIWDKDKNVKLNPWEIRSGSNKKIWVKCQEKDYHGSYETACSNFSKGKRCPYCHGKRIHPKDSLGQYIINKYSKEFLYGIWSDKNSISPFELFPNSTKKVWWKCIDGIHDDYLRTCNNSFVYEFRCPECIKEMNSSVIQEKTRIYLEEVGFRVLTEYECTIKAMNPKTKRYMPYDNEIVLHNGKHLIIEVHGEQHYRNNFYKLMYKCSNKEAEEKLKQRKLYDRYKKYIAWKNNYEYLELPYWSFEGKNKDFYKQMIDNKIKEILEKEEDIA